MKIEDKILTGESLAPLTTYQIGGPAEYFIAPETEAEMKAAVIWAHEHQLHITILGGGSNMLISDDGIAGLVIQPHNKNISVDGLNVIVGASTLVKTLAEQMFDAGLSGIEWSIGIPGYMGGAIRGNAGAHGGSFDQVVAEVTVFDLEKLEFKIFNVADCHFTYRHSFFKETEQYVIWEVILQLQTGNKEIMKEQMEEYRAYRRTSQPNEPSAGCVFKNLLVAELEKDHADIIIMAQADNKIRGGKIGAGYLIQKLNLMGYAVGGAQVSNRHANFVVNTGKAKAKDVLTIIAHIKREVLTTYGIEFEPEIQIINESLA